MKATEQIRGDLCLALLSINRSLADAGLGEVRFRDLADHILAYKPKKKKTRKGK